jgi:MFS family permease
MTGSPFLVSLVPITMLLPMLILSLPAGILADRSNRRKIVIGAESAALLGYVALTAIAIFGNVQVWHVLALSTLTGVIMATAGPSRMSVIAHLVPAKELQRGVGLSAVVFNLAQIAGPAMGGILIGQFGTEAALAASLFFTLPAIFLYKSAHFNDECADKSKVAAPVQAFKDGLRYVGTNPELRNLLIGALIVIATISTRNALMPTFTADVLGRGPEVLGLLTLAAGVGALFGSILSVALASRVPHQRVELVAALVLTLSVLGFAASPWLGTSILFAMIAGMAQTTFMVTNMTVAQVASADEFRGRVQGIRFLIVGLQPVGVLVLGLIAESYGPQIAVVIMASVGAVGYGIAHVMSKRHAGA